MPTMHAVLHGRINPIPFHSSQGSCREMSVCHPWNGWKPTAGNREYGMVGNPRLGIGNKQLKARIIEHILPTKKHFGICSFNGLAAKFVKHPAKVHFPIPYIKQQDQNILRNKKKQTNGLHPSLRQCFLPHIEDLLQICRTAGVQCFVPRATITHVAVRRQAR